MKKILTAIVLLISASLVFGQQKLKVSGTKIIGLGGSVVVGPISFWEDPYQADTIVDYRMEVDNVFIPSEHATNEIFGEPLYGGYISATYYQWNQQYHNLNFGQHWANQGQLYLGNETNEWQSPKLNQLQTNLTFCVWFRNMQGAAPQPLLGGYHYNVSAGWRLACWSDISGASGGPEMYIGASTGPEYIYATQTNAVYNTWHHYTFKYQPGKASEQMGCTIDNSNFVYKTIASPYYSGGATNMGYWINYYSGSRANGYYRGARFYGRELSQEENNILFEAGPTNVAMDLISTNDLIMFYSFGPKIGLDGGRTAAFGSSCEVSSHDQGDLNRNVYPFVGGGLPGDGVEWIDVHTNSQGWINRARRFNGVDDIIYTANAVVNHATLTTDMAMKYTIDGWFRHTNEVTTAETIATLRSANNYHHGTIALQSNGISFYREIDMGKFITYTNEAMLTDGLWHHVCGTFDNTNMRFYVDGVKVGTTPSVYTTGNDQYFRVGGQGVSASWYSGDLDEITLYTNRFLLDEEVADLHDNTCPTNNKRMPRWLYQIADPWLFD